MNYLHRSFSDYGALSIHCIILILVNSYSYVNVYCFGQAGYTYLTLAYPAVTKYDLGM